MSQSRQRIQRHHQWLCILHFGRLSPGLILGQRPTVWIGPSFGVCGSWIGLQRTHRRSVTICYEYVPHTVASRRSTDWQSSQRGPSQAGLYFVWQIDAPAPSVWRHQPPIWASKPQRENAGPRELIVHARSTLRRKNSRLQAYNLFKSRATNAQGASTAHVNAMCKNLKMGTVMGKTEACAISTVAWFFGEKRVPQTATRVEQVSEWITMWGGFNVDTWRRIRKVCGEKAPILANDPRRWNQAIGPISATKCSVLEAGWKPSTPGFWQAPDASATLDGALFDKAQIIDNFSKDMEMQTWKRAAGHSLSSGMEKGIITDFSMKAMSQLIKEGNFMAALALDFLVCGAINEPHLLADGSTPNQIFRVRCDQRTSATRKHELWECLGNRLINHAHMKESGRLVTLAQKFWDTDQVLFARGLLPRDWLPSSELEECSEVRMWESSGFKVCASGNVLMASDGSGGSRQTPKSVRQVAFGVAHSATHPSSCYVLVSWEARYQAGRRFQEPSYGEPSKSSAVSTRSRTSQFRLMRNT